MRYSRGFILAGLLLMTGMLVLAGLPGELEARTAPDFQLQTLAGEVITKDSLKGHPTLLMFWASWCQTCQKELPNLKALYEEKKLQGLQAVAIGFKDSESNIRGYVKGHPQTFSFPTAHDVNNQVSRSFGVGATPTFVLLNAQGEVILVHVGGGFLRNPSFKKFLQEI